MIGDQAGQAVGFALNQTCAVGDAACQQTCARLRRLRNTFMKKCSVDFAHAPIPHAGADLRLGTVRRNRERHAIG